MRKIRSDSKLLNLPEEQRTEILNLMESGISYKELKPLLEKEFGIRSSFSSLSDFYSLEKGKRLVEQRLRSLAVAQSVSEEAQKRPSMFIVSAVEQFSQLAFELSIQQKSDPDL